MTLPKRPYGTPITEAELKLLLRYALKADPPEPRRTIYAERPPKARN